MTAATRVDGAQAVDVEFALDAGNVDPQGIADPLPKGDQANELSSVHDPAGHSNDVSISLPLESAVNPFIGELGKLTGLDDSNIGTYRSHTNGSESLDPQRKKMLLTDVMFANSSGQFVIDNFQDQAGDHDPILRQIGKAEAPSQIAVSSFNSFADELDAAFSHELDDYDGHFPSE